ncbi:MAG: nuclear transport factor 2 family protein [Bacteroidota bacterium]
MPAVSPFLGTTHLRSSIMAASILPVTVAHSDSWTDAESANVRIVTDFVHNLMNTHDFDYVRETFGSHPYVQHSRGIPDGMMSLIDFVSDFAKRFPDYTYDVKHARADGDHVTFHSHATIRKSHRGDDTKGLNIIDTWRLVDGQIVEHWDAIQPLDAFMRFYVLVSGGTVRNGNGLF